MTRQLFTGNYGSSLGNYNMAAQLEAQRGASLGAAFQSVGTSIAEAMEKHKQKKQKESLKPFAEKFVQSVMPDATPEEQQVASASILQGNNLQDLSQLQQVAARNLQMKQQEQTLRLAKQLEQYQVQLEQSNAKQAQMAQKFAKATEGARLALAKAGATAELNEFEKLNAKYNLQGGATGAAEQELEDEATSLEFKKTTLKQAKSALESKQEEKELKQAAYNITFDDQGNAVVPDNIRPELRNQAIAMAEGIQAKRNEIQRAEDEQELKQAAYNITFDDQGNAVVPDDVRPELRNQAIAMAEGIQAKRNEIQRAEEEWKVNKANKKAHTKYLLSMVNGGKAVTKTAFERGLDEAVARKSITSDEKDTLLKAKLFTDAGLNQRIKLKDQFAILGQQKVGAGMDIDTLSGLVQAAERGDTVNGKQARIVKGKIRVYDSEGNKYEILYDQKTKGLVEEYNELRSRYLSNPSTTIGSSPQENAPSEEKTDALIDNAFKPISF